MLVEVRDGGHGTVGVHVDLLDVAEARASAVLLRAAAVERLDDAAGAVDEERRCLELGLGHGLGHLLRRGLLDVRLALGRGGLLLALRRLRPRREERVVLEQVGRRQAPNGRGRVGLRGTALRAGHRCAGRRDSGAHLRLGLLGGLRGGLLDGGHRGSGGGEVVGVAEVLLCVAWAASSVKDASPDSALELQNEDFKANDVSQSFF